MKLTQRLRNVEDDINALPGQLEPSATPQFGVQRVTAHGSVRYPDGRRFGLEHEFSGSLHQLSQPLKDHLPGNGVEAVQLAAQLIDDALVMRLMELFNTNNGFGTGLDPEAIQARLVGLKQQNAVITDTIAQTQSLPGGLRIGGSSLRGKKAGVTSLYEAVIETPILAQGMAEKDYNLLFGSTAIQSDGEILEGKKNSPLVVGTDGLTIDFNPNDPTELTVQLLLAAWLTAHSIPHMNHLDDQALYGPIDQTADRVRNLGIITGRPHHTSPDVVTSTNWPLFTRMQMAIRAAQRKEAAYLVGNQSRPKLEYSCGPDDLEKGASYYTAVATLEAGLRASQLAHRGKRPKFLVAGSGGVSMEMMLYALQDRQPDQLQPDQFIVFNPYASPVEEARLEELGIKLHEGDYPENMNKKFFEENGITAVLDNSPGRNVRSEHLHNMGDYQLVLMGAANALLDPEDKNAPSVIREKNIFYVPDTFTNGGGVYFALIDMALRTLFKDGVPAELRPKIHEWIMRTLVGMTHKNIDEASRGEGSFADTSVDMIDTRQAAMIERKTEQYERFRTLIAQGESVQAVSELLARLHIPNVVGDELWNLVTDYLPDLQRNLTAQQIRDKLVA